MQEIENLGTCKFCKTGSIIAIKIDNYRDPSIIEHMAVCNYCDERSSATKNTDLNKVFASWKKKYTKRKHGKLYYEFMRWYKRNED